MKKGKDSFYAKHIKRLIDLVFVAIFSIPAIIIIFGCYIGIKAETKGPAFFVQERPGKDGKVFRLFKLRTMNINTKENGRVLTDMERMTKTGRVIRACSFDELPQLFNVLRGDMSFIGPRPLLIEYLPLYSFEQSQRHDVRPGISGWAQVNGRNELSWGKKFKRDVWYVNHICFSLDMKIFCMTIWNVLHHCGINAGIDNTMVAFAGNEIEEEKDNV